MKNILNKVATISYENTTYDHIELDALKEHHYPMGKEWQDMSKYQKLIFTHQGKIAGQKSIQ